MYFSACRVPGVIDETDLKNMAKDPIVFAMANPIPEIMPEDAAGHVAVMATGRSDYPNQINNVLVFSRHLSRRVKLPRVAHQRSDETRRRQRHRRHHRRRRTSSRLHHPVGFRPQSRRSRRRRSRRGCLRIRRGTARTRDQRNDVLITRLY